MVTPRHLTSVVAKTTPWKNEWSSVGGESIFRVAHSEIGLVVAVSELTETCLPDEERPLRSQQPPHEPTEIGPQALVAFGDRLGWVLLHNLRPV